MAKRDDRHLKPAQGKKQKMVTCTACRPNHQVPADEMVAHRAEVRNASARRAGSQAR